MTGRRTMKATTRRAGLAFLGGLLLGFGLYAYLRGGQLLRRGEEPRLPRTVCVVLALGGAGLVRRFGPKSVKEKND